MICDKCGLNAEPPNVKEVLKLDFNNPDYSDWVYVHKRCPKK